MTKQAFGLYSQQTAGSTETLVWVFTNAKDALTAFGRQNQAGNKNEAEVKSLTKKGSLTKGPNTLRAINDSIRKEFCQDASRLEEITECIYLDIPVTFKESHAFIPYVNAPKEMGLFLTETNEILWLFESARSLVKLGLVAGSLTGSSKVVKAAIDNGGGRITRPPFYIRFLVGDEKEGYAGNEEDRVDEMLDAVVTGGEYRRRVHGIRRIKCTEKACTRGYLEHTDENFYMNQARNDRCRECCKRRRILNEDKHFEEIDGAKRASHFSCKKCGEEKPIGQKASDRRWCRACCRH